MPSSGPLDDPLERIRNILLQRDTETTEPQLGGTGITVGNPRGFKFVGDCPSSNWMFYATTGNHVSFRDDKYVPPNVYGLKHACANDAGYCFYRASDDCNVTFYSPAILQREFFASITEPGRGHSITTWTAATATVTATTDVLRDSYNNIVFNSDYLSEVPHHWTFDKGETTTTDKKGKKIPSSINHANVHRTSYYAFSGVIDQLCEVAKKTYAATAPGRHEMRVANNTVLKLLPVLVRAMNAVPWERHHVISAKDLSEKIALLEQGYNATETVQKLRLRIPDFTLDVTTNLLQDSNDSNLNELVSVWMKDGGWRKNEFGHNGFLLKIHQQHSKYSSNADIPGGRYVFVSNDSNEEEGFKIVREAEICVQDIGCAARAHSELYQWLSKTAKTKMEKMVQGVNFQVQRGRGYREAAWAEQGWGVTAAVLAAATGVASVLGAMGLGA